MSLEAYLRIAAFVVVVAILGFSVSVSAESASLSGIYQLDEAASDEMVEAFEPAIDEMRFYRRSFARSAIEDADDPAETLRVEKNNDEISLQSGDEPVRKVPLDGETVTHEDGDGERVRIRGGLEDGTVVLHNDVEEGQYTSEYRLDDDGERLEIVMEMDFEDLPKKVDYRLVYERK